MTSDTAYQRALSAATLPWTDESRAQLLAIETAITAAADRGFFQMSLAVPLPIPAPARSADWEAARRANEEILRQLVTALRYNGFTVWVEQWPTEVLPNYFNHTATLRVTW